MLINNNSYQSIWLNRDNSIEIIDQTKLPYELSTVTLRTCQDAEIAIKNMQVRGAPLIGVTAAYGVCLQMKYDASDAALYKACDLLLATRPTAVNLSWALQIMKSELKSIIPSERSNAAYRIANKILSDDVDCCKKIGRNGSFLIEQIYNKKKSTVNILTHCNAGWLATVDWGTALAPIYYAYNNGIPLHVWVDETRPRNQGASLTAYELGSHGVDHTVIADNVGGHLMQHNMVDICIVGSDRTTTNGDVCNKIGTYLKALAAYDNKVPFYAALPCSTIDWSMNDGIREIPIEQRSSKEVTHITGVDEQGNIKTVRIVPSEDTKAANYGFDVTPAKYITGIITENGVHNAKQLVGSRSEAIL